MIIPGFATGIAVRIAVVAVLLLGCAGTGWYVQRLRSENAQLVQANQGLAKAVRESTELRAAEQVISKKHSAEIAQLKQQKGLLNAKLKDALAENRAWGDQMVPSGVADALGL